jgi:hypothetical protein
MAFWVELAKLTNTPSSELSGMEVGKLYPLLPYLSFSNCTSRPPMGMGVRNYLLKSYYLNYENNHHL